MFGGLHNIEMALWKTIGDFLEDSGWTAALTESGIATAGKANSFLTVSPHKDKKSPSSDITSFS